MTFILYKQKTGVCLCLWLNFSSPSHVFVSGHNSFDNFMRKTWLTDFLQNISACVLYFKLAVLFFFYYLQDVHLNLVDCATIRYSRFLKTDNVPIVHDQLVKRHTLAPSCVSAKTIPGFCFLQPLMDAHIKLIAQATSGCVSPSYVSTRCSLASASTSCLTKQKPVWNQVNY